MPFNTVQQLLGNAQLSTTSIYAGALGPEKRQFVQKEVELMAYVKRIVCLANSIKTGGKCIAGKEVLANGVGGWIRPVSERETAEVWPSESRYDAQYTQPKLLDIMDVPLLRAEPHNHQTENHVIDTTDPARRWAKVDVFPADRLGDICDHPQALWFNGNHTQSGGGGRNNCIRPENAAGLASSLLLIQPGPFSVRVSSTVWDGRTRTKYWGKFTYNNTLYILSLTDPSVTSAFQSHEEGEYPFLVRYLCVSLTEMFDDGRYHKLVAAVFQ